MQNNLFLKMAGPLFIVLFIDGMGLGLVIPVLNGLFFDSTSTFLTDSASTPLMRNMIYGLTIGIFMMCWFFGAAFLGDLSDRIGRKTSLLICLLGGFLSYLISGISVTFGSLTLLIIGRIISGLTSGSQPIAQAAIIDLSTNENKSRNIGYILLSLSLGFILGPLFGGILADPTIVSWFDFSTPFYFAAIISLLNYILLWVLFNETSSISTAKFKINPYHAIHIFVSAFKDQKVRSLSITFFIFILGWSSFYSFISIYLLKMYQFSTTEISLFMAVMGIGFGIGNGFVGNILAKRFTLRVTFLYSTFLSAIIILLMIVVPHAQFSWIMVAPLACCISVGYAGILTLFSNQVESERQGWVMGVSGSIMAFVFAVDGVILGTLAAWSATAPMYIASFSLALSVLSMWVLSNVLVEYKVSPQQNQY